MNNTAIMEKQNHTKEYKIDYYENTLKPKCISWYVDNELHRDGDEPARVYYDREGNKEMLLFYKHGTLHRENDKPALLFYKNNELRKFMHFYNGILTRNGDKPAECDIYDDKIKLCYYKNNKNYKCIVLPKENGNIE